MYIKHVILEGFKSYGARTDVSDFDPHFNAITGLNGSGKSNILDGILFVLGLSCLNNVRANNLMELIHKSGGYKRGNVSVVFDNKDRRPGKCPLGYERYDKITVSRSIEETGQCKYFLNGVVSTKKKIVDMFESVQLNISTPNFVIQQGKITKVVNMKPKEILHMIEETVGATVYQAKRDKTEKDLFDKDRYLDTVRNTLRTIIEPALAKQRKAQQFITEYNSLKAEVNARSQQFAVAAYGEWTSSIESMEEKLNKMKDTERSDKGQVKEIEGIVELKQKEIADIKEKNNVRVKEKLTVAEKELAKFRKKYDAAQAQYESANTNQKDAEKKVEVAEKAFKTESKQVQDFEQRSASLITESNAIQNEIKTAEENMNKAKERESEINAGKVLGDDGQTINLRERLIALDDEINKIRPKHDHEVKLVSNDDKSLKQKQAELAKTPSDNQIEKEFKAASNEVNTLKQQLTQKQIVPEEFSTLDSRCHELDQRINRLGVEKRKLVQQNWNLQFDYRDPVPNFNRNAVHGFLFELFTVKDSQKYGKPLEVASAGSWFNVIVDTPNISKDLIEKGNLPRRTTFMPLSAIHPSQTAKQSELDRVLGRGKAVVAMDLLDFDPKYTNLMANYFGRLVICNDMPVAKTVAFNMKFKAITMDGDVVDPDGLMQGGTRKNLGKTLEICEQFSGVNSELYEKTRELSELKKKLDYYRRFEGLIKSYETAERKLKSLGDLRKCTAFASLTSEIAELQGGIAKRKEIIKEWDTQLKKLRQESTSLKSKLECEEEVKTKDLKDIRAQIQKFKKDFDAASKKYAAKQKMYTDIDLDVNAKHDLLANYQKDIDSAKKDLEEAKQEVVAKKNTLDQELANFKEKEAVVEDILKENELLDGEVGALDKQIQEFLKKKQKLEVIKIKRDNEINVYVQKLKARTKELDDLKQNHNNVNFDDYENLPKPKESADELRNILAKAIKRKEEMSTKVDMESAEKLEVTLQGAKMADERSKLVEKNREHMTSAIDTLDVEKLKIVTAAYDQVNREFGLMMTTLLPEAQAKLVQVNDKDLSEGLNIHVCLGGVWKESLLELSGGQRSLVALALTLSLCMFNPAPFYVLDEVDAALDLSHTQNMGVIIQQRFKDTQFVCVSLKEGMFSNANVLYNVSFHQGVSTISRRARTLTASSKNKAAANRNRDDDDD